MKSSIQFLTLIFGLILKLKLHWGFGLILKNLTSLLIFIWVSFVLLHLASVFWIWFCISGCFSWFIQAFFLIYIELLFVIQFSCFGLAFDVVWPWLFYDIFFGLLSFLLGLDLVFGIIHYCLHTMYSCIHGSCLLFMICPLQFLKIHFSTFIVLWLVLCLVYFLLFCLAFYISTLAFMKPKSRILLISFSRSQFCLSIVFCSYPKIKIFWFWYLHLLIQWLYTWRFKKLSFANTDYLFIWNLFGLTLSIGTVCLYLVFSVWFQNFWIKFVSTWQVNLRPGS